MQEVENIAQYCYRIKDVVNAIRGATSQIDDDTVLSKVLRKMFQNFPCREVFRVKLGYLSF